jgi:hypothetical protein
MHIVPQVIITELLFTKQTIMAPKARKAGSRCRVAKGKSPYRVGPRGGITKCVAGRVRSLSKSKAPKKVCEQAARLSKKRSRASPRKCKKRVSSARRKAGMKNAKTNPWLKHVAKYRRDHPKSSYSEALKQARKSYKPVC